MDTLRTNTETSITKVVFICKIFSWVCRVALFIIVAWTALGIGLMIWSISTSYYEGDILPLVVSIPFLFFLYSADTCLIPLIIGKMLDEISSARTPFVTKNSKRLFILGIVLLFYAGFDFLLKTVNAQFLISVGTDSIKVGSFLYDFASTAGTTVNLFAIIIAAVFFALSFVFEYGVLLQQESDETL